ncbi:hypothetical protein M378DRAFT_41231, partial [Amanita muscaria Koide BX008]
TLISIGRVDDAGSISIFGRGRCEIRTDEDDTLVGIIPKVNGVYRTEHVPHVKGSANAVQRKVTWLELHQRLGHVSIQAIKDLVRRGIITGYEVEDTSNDFECRACIMAKLVRKSVPRAREGERANTFGDEVHSDLWGKTQVKTLTGKEYYISFTDDHS